MLLVSVLRYFPKTGPVIWRKIAESDLLTLLNRVDFGRFPGGRWSRFRSRGRLRSKMRAQTGRQQFRMMDLSQILVR